MVSNVYTMVGSWVAIAYNISSHQVRRLHCLMDVFDGGQCIIYPLKAHLQGQQCHRKFIYAKSYRFSHGKSRSPHLSCGHADGGTVSRGEARISQHLIYCRRPEPLSSTGISGRNSDGRVTYPVFAISQYKYVIKRQAVGNS